MTLFKNKYHRRSIRLKGYDYSSLGAYYVTMCTHNREYLFGDIKDGVMVLNEWGVVARKCWETLPVHFRDIKLDTYIVMPNHVHGIVVVGTRHAVPLQQHAAKQSTEQFGKPIAGSVPTIIRSFKSAVTKGINEMRRMPGSPVWQKNYYEHIVRDNGSLNRIR